MQLGRDPVSAVHRIRGPNAVTSRLAHRKQGGKYMKVLLLKLASLLAIVGLLAACANPQKVDRSDWVYVSQYIGQVQSPDRGTCHRGHEHRVAAPAVDVPDMLWIQIPPHGGARFLVRECASSVRVRLSTVEGKQALANCLRGGHFPVEVETMYVEPGKFGC